MPGKQNAKLAKIADPSVREALREFEAELRELFQEDEPAIILYGSYARGQATPESDIDILLLFQNDIHPSSVIQRISSVLSDINLRYQVLISILPTTEHHYRHTQEPFWNNVRREGVPITTY